MLSYYKPVGNKKDLKVLNHMVKGFVKDYVNAGDKLKTQSHNKIAKEILKSKNNDVTFWIHNNQLVGFTNIKALVQFVEIEMIYVLPEHRGKGLSTEIYKAIMSYSSNNEYCITLSMGRILKNVDYFRSLGFTNFIGNVVSSLAAEQGYVGKNTIQYGDKGLAHITTQGIFDLCAENVTQWSKLIDEMPEGEQGQEWFNKQLLHTMVINDTTGENAYEQMLKEVA